MERHRLSEKRTREIENEGLRRLHLWIKNDPNMIGQLLESIVSFDGAIGLGGRIGCTPNWVTASSNRVFVSQNESMTSSYEGVIQLLMLECSLLLSGLNGVMGKPKHSQHKQYSKQ